MRVKTGSAERFIAPNIHSKMDKREKTLRALLLNKIIDVNRPISLAEIEDKDKELIINSLSEKGLVVLSEDGAITGVYPVSALPTRHKVQLENGRSFYAMCAIDSLGIAYELEQDLSISSSCKKCDTTISVEIMSGRISQITPATTYAVHVNIEKYKDWASTC